MQDNKEAKKLYAALMKRGYTANEIGDETSFITKMQDKDNRKKFYNYAASYGTDLGDYDTYEKRLSTGLEITPQSTSTPTTAPTVEHGVKGRQSAKPAASTHVEGEDDPMQYVMDEDYYANNIQEDKKKEQTPPKDAVTAVTPKKDLPIEAKSRGEIKTAIKTAPYGYEVQVQKDGSLRYAPTEERARYANLDDDMYELRDYLIQQTAHLNEGKSEDEILTVQDVAKKFKIRQDVIDTMFGESATVRTELPAPSAARVQRDSSVPGMSGRQLAKVVGLEEEGNGEEEAEERLPQYRSRMTRAQRNAQQEVNDAYADIKAEETRKRFEEAKAQKRVAELKGEAENQYAQGYQKISWGFSSYPDDPVGLENYLYNHYVNPETKAAAATIDKAEEIEKLIKEAGYTNENWGTKQLGGAFRGLGQKLVDIGTWDFGATDVLAGRNAKEVFDKYEKKQNLLAKKALFGGLTEEEEKQLGALEITEQEQAYLEMIGLAAAAHEGYDRLIGHGYKVGEATGESLGYMMSFAASPTSGLGKAAAKGTAKAAGKAAMKKLDQTVVKGIVKEGKKASMQALERMAVKKYGRVPFRLMTAGGRVAGDVGNAIVITVTTGLGRTIGDYYDRVNGQALFDYDKEGNIVYGGQYGGVSEGTAAGKAITAQLVENVSEGLGEYLAPLNKAFGNLLYKGAKGVAKATGGATAKAIDGLADFIYAIPNAHFVQGMDRLLEKAKFNGTLPEFLEEVASNTGNALLVGDMNFARRGETGYDHSVFNRETNIVTFLSCAMMSGAINVTRAGGAAIEKGAVARQTSKAASAVEASCSTDEQKEAWRNIREQMEQATPSERVALVQECIEHTKPNDPKRKLFIDYAYALTYEQAYNASLVKARSAADIDQRHAMDAYDNGYHRTSMQTMNAAKNNYEYLRGKLKEMDVAEEAIDAIDSDPRSAIETIRAKWSGDMQRVALDYVYAVQCYNGMTQRIRDDIQGRIDQSNINIDASVNQSTTGENGENGKIQQATLKNGRKVYVVSGNITYNTTFEQGENGDVVMRNTINHNASDESIIIRDAETGLMRMVSPTELLSFDGEFFAEALKDVAAEQIRKEMGQTAVDNIDGKVTFQTGQTVQFVDDNGVSHDYTVVEDNGGDTITVTEDGKTNEEIPRDYFQQQADEERIARVAEADVQEETARAADEAQEQQAETEAREVKYKKGDSIIYKDAQGNEVAAMVVGHEENGNVVLYQGTDENGDDQTVSMSEADLNNALVSHNNASVASNLEEAQSMDEAQEAEAPTEIAPKTTATERIPKDEKGDPDYTKAETPDLAWDAIMEQTEGDAEMAQELADDMVKESEKKLEEAKKARLKDGASAQERLNFMKAYKASVEAAQTELDAWTAIADTQKRRAEETKKAEEETKATETPAASGERVEPSKNAEEILAEKVKEDGYGVSSDVDMFGHPFIETKDGNITFGTIDQESGLTAAPIRLSMGENTIGEDGKNHGYGLAHIEAGHGQQIRDNGFASVEEFVEMVASSYTDIREGGIIADNQTYLLELSDDKNNTLFIQLSRDGKYWNVNSAGIFKKKYSRNKPVVHTVPAVSSDTNTDAEGVNRGQNEGATATSRNSPRTSSASEVTDSQEKNNTSEGKVAENSEKEENETEAEAEANTEIAEEAKKAEEETKATETPAASNEQSEKENNDNPQAETGEPQAEEEEKVAENSEKEEVNTQETKAETKTDEGTTEQTSSRQRSENVFEKAARIDAENHAKSVREAAKPFENGKVKIVVYDTKVDLPAGVRKKVNAGKKVFAWANTKDGVPYVYLYAPAFRGSKGKAELQKTLLHEIVQHVGMEQLLGDKFKPLMYQLWHENMTDALRNQYAQYVWDNNWSVGDGLKRREALLPGRSDVSWDDLTEEEKTKVMADMALQVEAADEWLAKELEDRGVHEKSWFQKFADAIREILRKMGVNVKLSDSEIADLQRQSYELMTGQKAGSQETVSTEQGIPLVESSNNGNSVRFNVATEDNETIVINGDMVQKLHEEADAREKALAEARKNGTRFRVIDDAEPHKQAQLDIILQSNPAEDDYHTWIRKAEDIKTFDDILAEAENNQSEYGSLTYPDMNIEEMREAARTGEITIYSSKPIRNGVFVTPSRMNAEDYAGGGRVYSKKVSTDDVAWIAEDEGQFAKVLNKGVDEGNYRFRADTKKSANDTGSGSENHQAPVVSFADGANIRKNLQNLAKVFDGAEDSTKPSEVPGLSNGALALKEASGYQTPQEKLEGGIRFSMKTAPDWAVSYMSADNSQRSKEVVGAITSWYNRVAADGAVRTYISPSFAEYSNKRGLNKDGVGPLRGNVEYYFTFDVDTTCPRTMAFLSMSEYARKLLKRPMTINEAQNLIEVMRSNGLEIPCVYCYAENKRQALSENFLSFINSRQAVINAKSEEEAFRAMYGHKKADDPSSPLNAPSVDVLKAWRSGEGLATYNPDMGTLFDDYGKARRAVLTILDLAYRNGRVNAEMTDEKLADIVCRDVLKDEDDTYARNVRSEVRDICNEWRYDVVEQLAQPQNTGILHRDTMGREMTDLGFSFGFKDAAKPLALWNQMTKYGKSSSSAHNSVRYIPYTNELKDPKVLERRDIINAMGGFRLHSSNDFRIDYVGEYLQFFADLAQGEWKSHSYSKSPLYVELFGNTGAKINMSIAAYDVDGEVVENQSEGHVWATAMDLRKKFPNAGTMFMTTSAAQLQYALDADWVDMIIPFHSSGLPKRVWYNMRAWEDAQSTQNEKFYNTDDKRARLQNLAYTEEEISNMREVLADTKLSAAQMAKVMDANTPAKDIVAIFTKKASAKDINRLYDMKVPAKAIVTYDKDGNRSVKRPHFLPGESRVDVTDKKGQKTEYTVPGWLIEGASDAENIANYKRLCEEYGVHPRFHGIMVEDANGSQIPIEDHPGYVKLIKEASRIDTPQTAVQFNLDQPTEGLYKILVDKDGNITGDKMKGEFAEVNPKTGKGWSAIDYAEFKLKEFAQNEGYDSNNLDGEKKYIVEQFIENYIGKPLGYLSEDDRAAFNMLWKKNIYDKEGNLVSSGEFGEENIPYHTKFRVDTKSEVEQTRKELEPQLSFPEVGTTDGNVHFRVLDNEKDKDLIEQLDNEEQITTYRAMAVDPEDYESWKRGDIKTEDLQLYPPMAFYSEKPKGRGKNRTEGVKQTGIKMGEWFEADENLDKAYQDENGNWVFDLIKDNGDVVPAAYNPYVHSSDTPLNDQFKTAYKRPNMVVVRTSIPKSELTSGYRAEHAKDAVGAVPWASGVVNGKLSDERKRQVYLSRWAKPEAVMDDAEVAKMIAEKLKGQGVAVPSHVVTPSLRKALDNEGVPVVETITEDGGFIKSQDNYPQVDWDKYPEYTSGTRFRTAPLDELTDEEYVDRLNEIENLSAETLAENDVVPTDKASAKEAYKNIGTATNKRDGREAIFYVSGFKKIYKENGLFEKAIPMLGRCFENSVLAYSEIDNLVGTQRSDGTTHREHPNHEAYHNYVGKVNIEGKDRYVRFTVIEQNAGESGVHSTFVSDVDIYEKPLMESSYPNSSVRANQPREVSDAKLKAFFENAIDAKERLSENANSRNRFRIKDFETELNDEVATEGLAKMYGEEYEDYLKEVFHSDEDIRRKIVERAAKMQWDFREATEKYLGELANDQTYVEARVDGTWDELKSMAENLLKPEHNLSDNELRYILWSNRQVATEGSKSRNIFNQAADITKQMDLKVGKYNADLGNVRFRAEDGKANPFEEAIFDAKLKLAANNEHNLRLRDDAMRAINKKIASIHQRAYNRPLTKTQENAVERATLAQRRYDRRTIDDLTRLTRQLMDAGFLNDMTNGEVKKIMSALNHANGMRELDEYADKILDVVINNQLKTASNALGKLLAIRGSKVDAKGVEVQGKLDIKGQRLVQTFKEAQNLGDQDLLDRIAKAENDMASPNKMVAENAAIEYDALNFAAQYKDNIRDSMTEEEDLKKEIKEAEDALADGLMTKEAFEQIVKPIRDAIRQNHLERANATMALASSMGQRLQGSIADARAFREREKERVQEIYHNANSDMEGRPDHAQNKKGGTTAQQIANNGMLRFFLKPLANFDQMLRQFGSKSINGEGYLWNRFMRGWTDATDNEFRGFQEASDVLDKKVSEVFGKKMKWSDLYGVERKMPKAEVKIWDNGEQRTLELTQGNLLYIYMVNKMVDGQMKLRKMGIMEKDVDAITRALDPRFVELADWVQEEFLVNQREKYNEVYKRMFGASMANIENYFPLRILANARVENVDVGDNALGEARTSTTTGAVKKRIKNTTPLDLLNTDAFSVVIEHLQEMEHWAAFAEYNRDLNTLLSYNHFKNQVMNMATVYGSGNVLWNNFKDCAKMSAGTYEPTNGKNDNIDKLALNVAKGVTGAKISFRFYTALKQILSAPAFWSDINIAGIQKGITHPQEVFKWAMDNLPLFSKRWLSRQAGNEKLMETDMDWRVWHTKFVEAAARWGMTANAAVDAFTVALGAKMVYDSRYMNYIKDGYAHEQADRRAKQDAAIVYNESQQSNEGAFLSTMQVDRSFLSTSLSVFRNSSMGYQRQLVDSVRNLTKLTQKGYKEESIEFMTKQMMRDGLSEEQARTAAERKFKREIYRSAVKVGIFGFGLQLLWNLGPYAVYLLFGHDDDKKKEMLDDALKHSLFGAFEGLTGGQLISSVGNDIRTGKPAKYWNTTLMPILSDAENLFQVLDTDPVRATNDIAGLVAQMATGVNPQTLLDWGVAIVDWCSDADLSTGKEAGLFLLRFLSAPQSQIENLYFDEIDMSGDEAKKLSPKELIDRYAIYKMRRNAPLTYWTYSDGAKQEVKEKMEKKYGKMVSDRLKAQGDEYVNTQYDMLVGDYKEIGKKIRELQAADNEIAKEIKEVNVAIREAKKINDYAELSSLNARKAQLQAEQKEAIAPYEEFNQSADYKKWETIKDAEKYINEQYETMMKTDDPREARNARGLAYDRKQSIVRKYDPEMH